MRPVLYRSVQYEAGDALPADDQATVAAWLEAESAKWLDDEGAEAPAPKAKRTAQENAIANTRNAEIIFFIISPPY